jgi:predicted transcriptional regulator
MSEETPVSPEKAKEMKERTRERNLIVQEIKSRGPSTIDELARSTEMEKSKLLMHLVAMTQFGKMLIVGERDNQLIYGLPERS